MATAARSSSLADVIAGRREQIYLVSKVLPENASRRGTIAACEHSLKRLRTDYLDLYLLHWRGSVPLEETLEAFTTLRDRGSIRHFGVSNFDAADLEEAASLPGGADIATNQVLYNLEQRGVEWNLLPWCREARHAADGLFAARQRLAAAAHAPRLESAGRAARRDTGAHRARVAAAAADVVVIPKASSEAHVRDNHAALALALTAETRGARPLLPAAETRDAARDDLSARARLRAGATRAAPAARTCPRR